MSDHDEPHDKKKVTAATTDAPQEEFISPTNVPSRPETEDEKNAGQGKTSDPPQR